MEQCLQLSSSPLDRNLSFHLLPVSSFITELWGLGVLFVLVVYSHRKPLKSLLKRRALGVTDKETCQSKQDPAQPGCPPMGACRSQGSGRTHPGFFAPSSGMSYRVPFLPFTIFSPFRYLWLPRGWQRVSAMSVSELSTGDHALKAQTRRPQGMEQENKRAITNVSWVYFPCRRFGRVAVASPHPDQLTSGRNTTNQCRKTPALVPALGDMSGLACSKAI